MKKQIAWILGLIMMFSLIPTARAADAGAVPNDAATQAVLTDTVEGAPFRAEPNDNSAAKTIPTGIYGTLCYDDAFRVLELVNQERAANGVAPLTMDQSLLDTAGLRAYELVVTFSHERPDGTMCFTANDLMFGENIAAGAATPEGVMSLWMNSDGHRANILRPDFKTIGIACVRVNGRALWVQCFGTQLTTEAQRSSYPATLESGATVNILADKAHYHPVFTAEKTELQVGEVAHVLSLWMGVHMDDKGLIVESSAPNVITVRDGVDFVAVGPGSAQITVYPIGAPDLAQTFTMRVTGSGAASKGFADVPADAWYADAVAWAVDRGVTNGTSETAFSPDATCTRAQVVTFLWRAAGSPAPKAGASFSDVQPGSYYEKAVQWAVEQGITNGVDAAHFAPEAPCTRAQVVTFLHRFATTPAAPQSSTFVDVPAGAWFSEAVNWAVSRGITNGMDATHFAPDNSCTRAQIVTFLYRYQTAG